MMLVFSGVGSPSSHQRHFSVKVLAVKLYSASMLAIRLSLLGLVATGLLSVVGCGGNKPDAESSGEATSGKSTSSPSGPKTYTVEQLTKTAKLGDALPPLDAGRVEIAPPEGWYVLPRDAKKYVVAMMREEGKQLPQIKVHSKESPAAVKDVANLTSGNVKDVIAKMGTSVARPSAEPNTPIILGPNTWIREVRKAEMGGDKVALQSLTTIRGGRLFIVELIVAATVDGDYADELKKHRDAAYLLAAEMKFLKPEAEISAEEAAPAAESDKPAEEMPAEEKPAPSGESNPGETNPTSPSGEVNPKVE